MRNVVQAFPIVNGRVWRAQMHAVRGAARHIARLVFVGCLGLSAGHVAAQASDMRKFVNLNACPIVERLERIEATSQPGGPNRFIVVSLTGRGQSYVQCLFLDDGISLLCEASSGRYGPKEGEAGFLRLSAPALAELADLGFETQETEGNFQIVFKFAGPEDFLAVVELLLEALYYGYGAWSGSALQIVAPLAPELPPGTSRCVPVS